MNSRLKTSQYERDSTPYAEEEHGACVLIYGCGCWVLFLLVLTLLLLVR